MILFILSASLRLHMTYEVLNLHRSTVRYYLLGRLPLTLDSYKRFPLRCPGLESIVRLRSRPPSRETHGVVCLAISSPRLLNDPWARSDVLPTTDRLLALHAPYDPIRPHASESETKTWWQDGMLHTHL